MKKKLLSMIICGVLSCPALAGASSSRPADVSTPLAPVCLVTISDGVYNGNGFTGLRHYDKGESIHTMVYFGNLYTILVSPNMPEAKRWENSFIALLRTRCGAI